MREAGGVQNDAPSGAEHLARIADRLGARGLPPRRFLRALAWNCAGIRPGLVGYLDLARGGRNRFLGRGFRAGFDDGTDGQARHFAGVAVSPVLLGEPLARLAHRWALRDTPDSADGRLSAAAVRFSRELRGGSLPSGNAGNWIREHVAE
jgi:hypothetical protein